MATDWVEPLSRRVAGWFDRAGWVAYVVPLMLGGIVWFALGWADAPPDARWGITLCVVALFALIVAVNHRAEARARSPRPLLAPEPVPALAQLTGRIHRFYLRALECRQAHKGCSTRDIAGFHSDVLQL